METMQMRARRAANPYILNSETRKGLLQALGSPKGARAAGGHWGRGGRKKAECWRGAGPGAVANWGGSGLRQRAFSSAGNRATRATRATRAPSATYVIYDKKSKGSERGGRMGKSSLMFAYVRLCSLNRRKNVEAH